MAQRDSRDCRLNDALCRRKRLYERHQPRVARVSDSPRRQSRQLYDVVYLERRCAGCASRHRWHVPRCGRKYHCRRGVGSGGRGRADLRVLAERPRARNGSDFGNTPDELLSRWRRFDDVLPHHDPRASLPCAHEAGRVGRCIRKTCRVGCACHRRNQGESQRPAFSR